MSPAAGDWTDRLYSLEVDAPASTSSPASSRASRFRRRPARRSRCWAGRTRSSIRRARPGTSSISTWCRKARCRRASRRWFPAIRSGSAPRANGFFSIGELPAADALWCISTGTGIGPFLSILRTAEPWEKFARVVLVHAVRIAEDLAYPDVIAGVARAHPGAFAYVPVVSREAHPGALPGRIPALIADGRLESRAGIALSPENSHAMLCGNPAMVDDVQATLAQRGMRRHRRKEPGHITLETYW